MKTNLQPLEDRVLVKPDEAPKQVSGIIIPESSQEAFAPARGTVIAAGPGKHGGPDMPVKVGDCIMYGKKAGLPIEDNGVSLLLMRITDIWIIDNSKNESNG